MNKVNYQKILRLNIQGMANLFLLLCGIMLIILGVFMQEIMIRVVYAFIGAGLSAASVFGIIATLRRKVIMFFV